MKYAKISMLLVLTAVFIIGCAKEDDEAAIRELLENSPYCGDGALQTSDDSTSTPQEHGGGYLFADTIPYVRWVRWIQRPVTWNYTITLTGDSADVTLTAYFHGAPPGYGFFVNNDLMGPVYQRTITDSVLRKAKLYQDDDGWHILSLTAAHIYTVTGSPILLNPILITEVKARVESRDYEFVINSANTYFKKDELPTFLTNDTVDVTVTLNVPSDSSWAFLHHGAGYRPGIGLRPHHRDPFYKNNVTTFTRTWYIADDSVLNTPALRHSAIDVVGWQTLFGDSTACYYARAWGLPYIVKTSLSEELPED